jgi:hypothetical protein
MVNHPRTNSYVDTSKWDQEAEKWFERQDKDSAQTAVE